MPVCHSKVHTENKGATRLRKTIKSGKARREREIKKKKPLKIPEKE